jgi:hypothetical protein
MRLALPLIAAVVLAACPAPEVEPETAEVRFEQATGGAMWANPELQDELPVVLTTDSPFTVGWVTVKVGDRSVEAEMLDVDRWLARLPIDELAAGAHTIAAEAKGGTTGGVLGRTEVELVLGAEGVQVTTFEQDGAAGTPRLHRDGDALLLSWVARNGGGDRQAWLQAIDGAGRPLGDPLLLSDPAQETLYARVTLTAEHVVVLGQDHGAPYTTWLRLLDRDGQLLVERIDLDPDGGAGAFGGDVAWDGQRFWAVWRSLDGVGGAEVRALHLDPADGDASEPIVVAASGAADPHGHFDPFSFVGIEAIDGRAVVVFTRHLWSDALDMTVPRAQYALVDAAGGAPEVATLQTAGAWDFPYDQEGHVHRVGDRIVALWTSDDLTSAEEPIPTEVFGSEIDPVEGPLLRTLVFVAPDTRGEPFLIGHPDRLGTMVWIDHRAYTETPAAGRIALYAAPVGDDLTADDVVEIPHAVLVAGLSQPGAVALGTNTVLSWIDERHGAGIMDPKPEVWLETLWHAPE